MSYCNGATRRWLSFTGLIEIEFSSCRSSHTAIRCTFPLKGTTRDVYLSWIDDPDSLFVTLTSQSDVLDHVGETLEQIYSTLQIHEKRLGNFQPGSACVAK